MVLSTFATLATVSFFAGIVSAMVGGAGMIILPSLLLAGLPLPLALGTNKLFTTVSLSTAAWGFFKKDIYRPRLWIIGILASAFGAAIGASLIHVIPVSILNITVPVIIIIAACYCVIPHPTLALNRTASPSTTPQFKQLTVGSCLGVYSGAVGAATGTLWVAFLTRWFRLDILEANAISRLMCFITNVVALAVFAYLKEINYTLGLVAAACGMLGARLGVYLVLLQGKKTMRFSLASATLVMAFMFIYQNWF